MKKMFYNGLCIMLISFLLLPTIFADLHATQQVKEDHHDSFPVINQETKPSDYPNPGEAGHVQMRKSAKWTDLKAGKAEIKFELSGKATNSDVVIVLDRSGSMADDVEGSSVSCGGTIVQNKCMKCGKKHSAPAPNRCDDRDRLAISQGAATNFVNAMLANDEQGNPSNNRVGFVSFSGKSGDPAIDNTMQIVTSTNFVDGNGKQALISSINSLEHLGGTDYTPALEAAKKMIMNRLDKTRPTSIIFLTDGMPAPGQDGIASAASLKKMNTKVYSLALAIKNPTAKALLRDQIAYDQSCYYDILNPNDVQSVFNEIKKTVGYAGTKAILSDTIKNHFVYDSSREILINGTIDRNNNVKIVNQDVTWNIGNISTKPTTLIIPIRLNPNKDGVFPTNEGNARLNYTNFKHNPNCIQEVETPILRKNEQTFKILYEGNPPLGTSLIGTVPKDDSLYHLDEKATILPHGNLAIKDYTFVAWLAGNTLYQPNEIINIKEDIVFKAVWEKNKVEALPYTVKYYKDNIDMNCDSSGFVLSDAPIVHKIYYGNLPEGYELDLIASTPLPFNVTMENKIIKVVYKKIKEIDPPVVSLPYTIKYYKDKEDMNCDITGSVLSDNSIVQKVNTDNLPKGYELDLAASTPLPFTVTTENKIIKVVYKKIKEINPPLVSLPYTIKYYKDNIDMNCDITGSVLSDNSKVNKVNTDNLPKGYELDLIASTPLPFNVTTENKIIKVVYKKIKEIDPPVISLPYTIKYYKDKEDMNCDITGSVLSDNSIVQKVNTDNLPKGYELDLAASTPLPFTVTTENKIIKVVYKKIKEMAPPKVNIPVDNDGTKNTPPNTGERNMFNLGILWGLVITSGFIIKKTMKQNK